MELIEIAQLVTGIATLIVASVLIWQMFIQKKTLDIAHNDADANVSLMAMDTRARTNEWFAENCSPEMIDKFDKGLNSLSQKEFMIIESYFRSTMRVLGTEWRLGRLTDFKPYYKNTFFAELRFDHKLFREYWLDNWYKTMNLSDTYTGLAELGKEAYEESSGEKIGD